MNRWAGARTYVSLFIVVIVAVLMGYQVYWRLIAPAAPLNFDEAAHSLPGFYILRDVRNLDARAFWGDTHIQTLWPPGFSYLQAPVLALLGRSDAAARLFAYLMLVLTALMAYPIVRQIRPSLAPMATLVSALFAFSAPGWLFVSSWAMQETPVAFVLFGVFWMFLKAQNTGRVGWYLATGVGLFFLFLTKYNYAAFALAAIGLVDLIMRVRTRAWASLPFLYVPFALGLFFWFFGGTDIVPSEVKWRDFRFFVTNEDSGYVFWSAQNLLFYMRVAAQWLMPNAALVVFAAGLAVVAVVKLRRPGVMLLALFFGLGFVLATAHQLKAERYISPLFPSLWLLAGLGAAYAIEAWTAKGRTPDAIPKTAWQWGSMAVALMLFTFVLVTQTLPRLQPVWAGEAADGLRAAADQIVAWQDPQRSTLIIGTFGELSPPLFEWRLRPQPVYAADQAHGEIQYDAPPGEGSDLQRVSAWARHNPGTQITVIRVDLNGALYNTADMHNKNAWRQTLAEQFEANSAQIGERGYRLVQQKTLPGMLKVSYYLPN